jgi:hypothetical protein
VRSPLKIKRLSSNPYRASLAKLRHICLAFVCSFCVEHCTMAQRCRKARLSMQLARSFMRFDTPLAAATLHYARACLTLPALASGSAGGSGGRHDGCTMKWCEWGSVAGTAGCFGAAAAFAFSSLVSCAFFCKYPTCFRMSLHISKHQMIAVHMANGRVVKP